MSVNKWSPFVFWGKGCEWKTRIKRQEWVKGRFRTVGLGAMLDVRQAARAGRVWHHSCGIGHILLTLSLISNETCTATSLTPSPEISYYNISFHSSRLGVDGEERGQGHKVWCWRRLFTNVSCRASTGCSQSGKVLEETVIGSATAVIDGEGRKGDIGLLWHRLTVLEKVSQASRHFWMQFFP